MQIIPAIDLCGGKCVRLYKGDYAQEKQYDDDPAARARLWAESGAELIHIVDLDGAKSGERVNTRAISAIRGAVTQELELGGGIRTLEDARVVFDLGINRVIIGTAALHTPTLVEELAALYPGRVLLGADARNGSVAVDGWRSDSRRDVYEFARSFTHLPLAGVIFTDVDTDGTLAGPNIEAQRRMAETMTLPLIASGGISSIDDLLELERAGIPRLFGVIVGRALYEECFTLEEAIRRVRGG